MNQEEIMQQLQAAVALHNQGEFDQAEAIYRQILAVDANNFYTLRFLGCVCRQKGLYQEGVFFLSRAVSLSPCNSDCWYNLGNVYMDACLYKRAVECFEEGLRYRNEFPEALINLGYSLFELGRFEESMHVLERGLLIKDSCAQGWMNLGNTFNALEKSGNAIACFRRSIKEDCKFMGAYLNLGIVLRQEGELEEAIASYRKAIEVKPDFAEAYLNLGVVLKEEGEVEEAIANFRKAIEVKPDFADAHKELATLLHEENEAHAALALYESALEIDEQVSDCSFHLFVAGLKDVTRCFLLLQSEVIQFMERSDELTQEVILLFRCIYNFSKKHGMKIKIPDCLGQDFSSQDLLRGDLGALDGLLCAYALCRKALLPRWMHFEDAPTPFLLVSDYLEFLRVDEGCMSESFLSHKNYQFIIANIDAEGLPFADKLFVKDEGSNERLWLAAERFQFPEMSASLSLKNSLIKKESFPDARRQEQSEFFRKAHLLDAQKFYIAEEDPCLHGMSELYRVHGIIADTIGEIDGLKDVVDLGYYSCGIFNAGLKANFKRYCIEPARHHAVWVAESGIAEVVPDVPERCVRSFEEYLCRLDAVALDDSGSTAAVISFILQLFEYEQCVEILQRVKGFASHLVVTDDILNEETEESILRLLSNGKRMNLCHNYKRLMADAGWRIEQKWYFHGVRYASGIIVASAA